MLIIDLMETELPRTNKYSIQIQMVQYFLIHTCPVIYIEVTVNYIFPFIKTNSRRAFLYFMLKSVASVNTGVKIKQ